MDKRTYKKRHSYIVWGFIALASLVLGALLYIEWTTPLSKPSITGIVSYVPSKVTPPSNEAKNSYSVAPDHPKILNIPKLEVDAIVRAVGVTKSGALDVPQTAWDVGWYNKSALPGKPGAMLINGHVNDSFNTPGVFAGLQTLTLGDIMTLEKGDGTVLRYEVVRVETQPANNIDMQRILQPVSANSGLNLITCGGTYDRKNGTFSDRVLVFAEQL